MLITHGNVITWDTPNQILEDHAILVTDGTIQEIGKSRELEQKHPDEERFDAKGQYILPGNICAHTHFYGAFARGMATPGEPASNFSDILRKLWWPLDKSLTLEDVRYSALVCLVDAVKHGTTLLIDHHASPNAIDGSLDVIEEAVEKAGLRAVLCYEVTDRDGPEKAKKGIRENIRFLKKQKSQAKPHSRIAATFGLHASLTLSDDTLDECKAVHPDGGFHIHAAEGDADQLDSINKAGMRVIHRLHQHGIDGPESIFAHCVRVDEKEIAVLSESKTWVTHQPRSNMNNGVGTAPVEQMLAAGIPVGLGNDGFSNAMWEEWKAAYLIHKAWHRDPTRMPATSVVQMAIMNNSALAGVFFPEKTIGKIKAGAAADLIFVEFEPYTTLNVENLPWQMVFGFHESMITSTMVAGNFLMKDKRLLNLDEAEIAARARELSSQVWERYNNQFNQ